MEEIQKEEKKPEDKALEEQKKVVQDGFSLGNI